MKLSTNLYFLFLLLKGGTLAKELKKREEEINKNSEVRIKIVEGGWEENQRFIGGKKPIPHHRLWNEEMSPMQQYFNQDKISLQQQQRGLRTCVWDMWGKRS